jgi:hypothetical protein
VTIERPARLQISANLFLGGSCKNSALAMVVERRKSVLAGAPIGIRVRLARRARRRLRGQFFRFGFLVRRGRAIELGDQPLFQIFRIVVLFRPGGFFGRGLADLKFVEPVEHLDQPVDGAQIALRHALGRQAQGRVDLAISSRV